MSVATDRARSLRRLDFALAALTMVEAGDRMLERRTDPSWRARAEERYDAAERAGVTGAELITLLREHGQVS